MLPWKPLNMRKNNLILLGAFLLKPFNSFQSLTSSLCHSLTHPLFVSFLQVSHQHLIHTMTSWWVTRLRTRMIITVITMKWMKRQAYNRPSSLARTLITRALGMSQHLPVTQHISNVVFAILAIKRSVGSAIVTFICWPLANFRIHPIIAFNVFTIPITRNGYWRYQIDF